MRYKCAKCVRNRRMLQLRLRLKAGPSVRVKTWCRICNAPVELEVPTNFDKAHRMLYGLDDLEMNCRKHRENGGWGWHWRFDDVLAAVFGRRETDLPYWPLPPWYEHYDELEPSVEVLEAEA